MLIFLIAQENGGDSSEPQSRARTPSPDRQSRPTKRRKVRHKVRGGVYQDGGCTLLGLLHQSGDNDTPTVVTKGIISEKEARELFRMYGDLINSPEHSLLMDLVDSFTDVLLFFPCLTPTRILMMHCMIALLSPLIVFVWLLLELETVEARYSPILPGDLLIYLVFDRESQRNVQEGP